MLNKILLRKIKFPLSLRGLFPFCHSRGSGNPSPPSLRGAFPHVIAKERSDRSNLKGFSLIELMVAVAILALAIFGIFHAYSTGFMGMADARDRTVATNYLQQTIEDFKSMDFIQVNNEPITPIPDTKFSRGTYVLNLEEIDGVVTLKKVISQVRWVDRKGNIKTEKASTILYKKPATSEVSSAARIIIYAQPYYTILPSYTEGLDLYAEIKDENGNTVYGGDITFSIITSYDPNDDNDIPVGYIYSPGRTKSTPVDTGIESAPDGTAHVKFYPFTFEFIDGIERIQASAIIDGVEETDTVNIRVSTGPVGIILKPATEGDRILPADESSISNINLAVVKADYEEYIAYDKPITLSADGPGTLSTTTIASVPTEGTSFTLTSNGTPGKVEITASAPDLDIGYTEIVFTGEPTSILVTPEKKSIYPGEDINIIVTIVDENNVSVEYDEVVNLSAGPDYGSFSPNSLNFGSTSLLELESTFTAYTSAPPGETITLQANSDGLSGSSEITILSLLTPKYLKLFANPTSVDLVGGGTTPTITATVLDVSGTKTVTTYNTPITFYAKVVVGGVEEDFNGTFSNNDITPTAGEAEAILSSDVAGTVTITASSGELLLRPEEGVEVVFYKSAHHIVLSADPTKIEADGHETSIITATVCDEYGNRVANYSESGDKSITIKTSIGGFPENDNWDTITSTIFDEGQMSVALSSTATGTAMVTAESNDGLNSIGYDVTVEFTGNISTEISLGEVINWDDYRISFDLTVTGSPLYLTKINIKWNNSKAVLYNIIIYSPYDEQVENSLNINAGGLPSPYNNTTIEETLTIEKKSTIYLHFGDVSNAAAKMKNNTVIVTFTDEDNIEYPPLSFKIP